MDLSLPLIAAIAVMALLMVASLASKNKRYIMVYAAVIVILVAILVIFNKFGSPAKAAPVIVRGWNILQPLSSSASYSSGTQSFKAEYKNMAVAMKITEARTFEAVSGMNCTTKVNGIEPNVEPQSVAPGSSFVLQAECRDAARANNSAYSMHISITYENAMAGSSVKKSEQGEILGTAG